MKHRINVEGIMLYGYHGCLEEEARIGQEYRVDVYMHTDFTSASVSDNLAETIDYCVVYDIVKREMAIRSKLIEHVGRRIKECLLREISGIDNLVVKITKFNPPMNGNVQQVSIEI